jgi:hypothetical protein
MRTASISGMNRGQSRYWPGLRIRATGRQRRSAARWILVLSPPRERPSASRPGPAAGFLSFGGAPCGQVRGPDAAGAGRVLVRADHSGIRADRPVVAAGLIAAGPRQARPGCRMAVSLSALAGIGYTAAWIISVSVGAPNPSVAVPGSQVVAAFGGPGGPALAMFALAEGVAAIALVAVVIAAARAARRCGHARAGLAAAAFGIAVAGVSWAELALGTWLISGLVPDRRTGTAGAVYHAIIRMDGAKMLLLAAMALAISELASPAGRQAVQEPACRDLLTLRPGLLPSRPGPHRLPEVSIRRFTRVLSCDLWLLRGIWHWSICSPRPGARRLGQLVAASR